MRMKLTGLRACARVIQTRRLPFLLAGAVYALLVAPTPIFARGGGGCLEKGTAVLTPSGLVAVEQLKPGDAIISVSGKSTLQAEVRAVTQVFPEDYVELVAAGCVLRLTATHPIGIAPGVFRTAGVIQQGDTVMISGSNALRSTVIDSITYVPARSPAFDLLVAPGGTYLANSVVVHNKGCFLPETLIRMAGNTETAISQIKPGHALLAFTPDGTMVTTIVYRVLTHDVEEYCAVQTEAMLLYVTPEHPFYVGNGTFKTLEALNVGDAVFVFDGQALTPQPIRKIETIRMPTRVYNLQTDAPNTFFANGVAVHNKGGGGGSFSSHSSRSSYSSHGGSGGTPLDPAVGMVVFLVFTTLVVSCFIVSSYQERKSRIKEDLDFVYKPARVARKADKTRKLLEFLARQDLAMTPKALQDQAEATFLQLQECWQSRNYEPMKPLMMDDLHADHCRQIAGMVRNHEINMIEKIKVDRIDLVNVRYTAKENQREFTALITATAKDYYLDDRTKKRLRGDTNPAQFQEFWTFQRQDKTWLLREVEQSRESNALEEDNFFEQFTDKGLDQIYGDTADKPGEAGPWLEKDVAAKVTRIERLLNFLVQTDKIWDRQTMLVTTRKAFLELMGAWETCDSKAISDAGLFPALAVDLHNQIKDNRAKGIAMEFRNLCVRKLELILIRNFDDNSKDEFVVRVRAHAQRIIKQRNSVLLQDEFVTPFEHFITMGRLDGYWKLKEILLPAGARKLIASENLDQDSNLQQLQWYYQHKRAV